MTTKEIIELILGSGGLIGIFILIFRMGSLVEKVNTIGASLEEFKGETKKNFSDMRADTDNKFSETKIDMGKKFSEMRIDMDKKFSEMRADTDKKFSEMKVEMVKSFIEVKSELKEIKNSLNCMEVQLGKLETRVEERTLRVVHSDHSMA